MEIFAVTVSLLIYNLNALQSENILCSFNAFKFVQTEGPMTHFGFGVSLSAGREHGVCRSARAL